MTQWRVQLTWRAFMAQSVKRAFWWLSEGENSYPGMIIFDSNMLADSHLLFIETTMDVCDQRLICIFVEKLQHVMLTRRSRLEGPGSTLKTPLAMLYPFSYAQ